MVYRANVHEAKTQFSQLLRRAHQGEEVIICRSGRDYVRLIPIAPQGNRQAGAFKGIIQGDPLSPVDELDEWG